MRTMPEQSADDDLPLTISTYVRLRGLKSPRRRRRSRDSDDENAPFMPGRDPRGLGEVVDALARESGWTSQLAREDLVLKWAEVAGAETAAHAQPVALIDGTLTVQCDSTAWAKQLSLLRSQILTGIIRAHPEAEVTSIRFIGPDVPSWKRGLRAVPGRGPRDTYG